MALDFKMVQIKPLLGMMKSTGVDFVHFRFEYNKVAFECIVDGGSNPVELMIGAIKHPWACVLPVLADYTCAMPNFKFYELCDILNLKAGKDTFLSKFFLKYIDNHWPTSISKIPVAPSKIMRYRSTTGTADEQEKTVFIGWNDHKLDGRTAHNFEKTERYFGKKVADFCRKNNISSRWTTPDKAREATPSFPPGY